MDKDFKHRPIFRKNGNFRGAFLNFCVFAIANLQIKISPLRFRMNQ